MLRGVDQNLVRHIAAAVRRFRPRSHSTFSIYMGPLINDGSRLRSPIFQDRPPYGVMACQVEPETTGSRMLLSGIALHTADEPGWGVAAARLLGKA